VTTYYVNEIAFELPPVDITDRSVNILVSEAPSGGEITILVQRFRVPEGKSLRDLSKGRVDASMHTRAGYKVLSERETEVGEMAAIEVDARWRADVGLVFVREVHFSLGSMWMAVAGHGPLADQKHTCERLGYVVESIRAREDSEEGEGG
jgi:hypothetical protein